MPSRLRRRRTAHDARDLTDQVDGSWPRARDAGDVVGRSTGRGAAWGARLRPTSVLARSSPTCGPPARSRRCAVSALPPGACGGVRPQDLVSAVGGGVRAAVAGPAVGSQGRLDSCR
jgi:hypothetical protein